VRKIFRHLRLLPAVFVLCAGLLAVKGTDMTLEARAESAPATQRVATPAPAPSADPAADDSAPSSVAEVDVLTSLSKRRAELDAREQDLAMRANLIAAAEARVDGKIAQLKQLQTSVQALLGQRDDAEQKQIATLVKTYSSMKPKDAARIFNTLDGDVLLEVADQMKPDVLDAAQKLTVKLANRLKIPDVAQTQPAPAQLAAITPPPTLAAIDPATAPAPQATTPAPQAPQPAPAIATPANKTAAATPPAASPAATPAAKGAAPAGK
jgi:flagellar motility protein MotE (MotC chaperone)